MSNGVSQAGGRPSATCFAAAWMPTATAMRSAALTPADQLNVFPWPDQEDPKAGNNNINPQARKIEITTCNWKCHAYYSFTFTFTFHK